MADDHSFRPSRSHPAVCSRACYPRSGEAGEHRLRVHVEEAVLVDPDLLHLDAVVAGLAVLAEAVDVRLGVLVAEDRRATSFSLTSAVAASKWAGSGSTWPSSPASALVGQVSSANVRAAASVSASATSILP